MLVRYYEEQPDDKGTMMPRVTWAVRRRGCRNVSWYDVVEMLLRSQKARPQQRSRWVVSRTWHVAGTVLVSFWSAKGQAYEPHGRVSKNWQPELPTCLLWDSGLPVILEKSGMHTFKNVGYRRSADLNRRAFETLDQCETSSMYPKDIQGPPL